MPSQRYATVLRRILAGIIDTIIFLPITIGVDHILPDTNMVYVAQAIIGGFIWSAYSILMNIKYGGTLGKLLVGLRLLNVEELGSPSFRAAFIRDVVWNALYIFGSIVLIIKLFNGVNVKVYDNYDLVNVYGCLGWSAIEIFTALLNKKRRAIHDLMAGTVVVIKDIDRVVTIENSLTSR